MGGVVFEVIGRIVDKVRLLMFPKRTIDKITGGKSALSAEMIKAIDLWGAMLEGAAPWLTDDVKSVGIERGVVADFANTALSEMESSVSNAKLDSVYQGAIRELNESLQDGLALGSFVIKPLGDDSAVEYVAADRFVPVRFDHAGRPVEIIFVDIRRLDENKYAIRIEHHDLRDGLLTITNRAYRSMDGYELGAETALDIVEDWADLADEVAYSGVERPVFGYFRSPVKNRVDASPCGVSLYHGAAELIKDADEQYGRLVWEMKGGELAVHVDPGALDPNAKGKRRVATLSKRLYRSLDVDSQGKGFFEVFSPELRDASIINGLNSMLRRIEYSVGLSYGDLSDVQDEEKTAAEIIASRMRKYQTVQAIEANLRDCLDDLVYALAFWLELTRSGYEFVCDFHDSILTDEDAVLVSMREDVAAGIIRPEKYVARKYGVPEDQLGDWLPAVAAAPGE
jgi:A118 family predicted phage portal protein